MAKTKPPATTPTTTNRPESSADVRARRDAVLFADTTQRPLGVPVGYTATTPSGESVPATFKDGDEMVPAALPPSQVRRLQDLLATVGVLDEYRPGFWDPKSQAAYRTVLEFANGAGITDPQEAIRRISEAGPEVLAGSSAKRTPLVSRLTNPLDVAAIANDIAKKRTGQRFSDDQLAKFQAAYRQAELAQQQAIYKAGGSGMPGGPGGTIVDPPDLQRMAEAEAVKDNPFAAREMDLLNLNDAFMSALKGGGG